MYKKVLLYSCATILSFGVCQGASSETLKESVLQALETHPSVEAALRGRDAASATRKEAKSEKKQNLIFFQHYRRKHQLVVFLEITVSAEACPLQGIQPLQVCLKPVRA